MYALASRVKETTTTTGTGNITLSGAATNFQTFNATIGTGIEFLYWIIDDTNNDWESGIGSLSDSTTLVRGTILRSSNSDSAVSFSAGTKDVFINDSGEANEFTRKYNTLGINQSEGWYLSDHIPYDNNADANIDPNKVYCVPMRWYGGLVSSLGTKVSTTIGSATKFRLGIYAMAYDSTPGPLLAQTGDLTPVVNTFVSGALGSSVILPAGWYLVSYIDDGGARLAGQNGNTVSCSPLGMRGGTYVMNYYADTISSGWTELPASLTIDEEQHTNAFPRICVK